MSRQIIDPILKAIFDKINKRAFKGLLWQPINLSFNYNLRKAGGYFKHWKVRDTRVWIEVKGTLKSNPEEVYQTLAHEMTHQFMYQKWHDKYRHLSLDSFYDDKSSMFIVALTEVAESLGYTYDELAYWDRLNDTPDDKINQSAYVGGLKINDMLDEGFWDD